MSRFSPADRWFCEGRELHNSPDIQIWRDGDLHTLVISEAFEDDTGRYNCVASNSLGADNTSAEVYIEGQPLPQQQIISYPNIESKETFRTSEQIQLVDISFTKTKASLLPCFHAGASSSDSDTEGAGSLSRSGAMPQYVFEPDLWRPREWAS